MARRKPTIPERAQLARAAVEYIEHYTVKGEELPPYELAFRGLGKIAWLHAQSRDGIAAYAASCWVSGQVPYSGVDAEDLQAGEDRRQYQSWHSRTVALAKNAGLRAERDAKEAAERGR